MLDSFLDGNSMNLFVALVAGFVTFFASCLLPLVPTYLAYLSGVSLNSDDAGESRFQIIKVAFFFVIGFITTFVLLSLTINLFGGIFSSSRAIIEKIAGFIFIILGLFMLGVFKHRLFSQERRLSIGNKFSKYKNFHAVLTGIAFGFGWTPCIGPVLAAILYWSSTAGSTFNGILLLVFYGIGLGIPFMIVAAGFEKVIPLLKKYARISQYVSYLSGAIIILAGVLMIIGQFQSLSLYCINLLGLRSLSG